MQTTKRGTEARKANNCDHNVRQRCDRQGIEEVLQAEDWELLPTEPPLEGKRERDYVLNPPKLQLRRGVDKHRMHTKYASPQDDGFQKQEKEMPDYCEPQMSISMLFRPLHLPSASDCLAAASAGGPDLHLLVH